MIITKKIQKMLRKPIFLFCLWISFLLSPLLGIFRMRYLLNRDIFGIHIKGLSTFIYYFPFLISFIVLIVLIIWFREFIDKKFTVAHKRMLFLLSILTLVFLMISSYLINLQYNNYPNYLYEHYGITFSHLRTMTFVASLELLTFMVVFIYTLKNRVGKVAFKTEPIIGSGSEKASLFIAIIGFLSMMILSFQPIFSWPNLLSEARGGYEKKVGAHYKYINALEQCVPIDGLVIHPPQGDNWPAIGNQPVLRYFLYPRTLVSGALLENQDFALSLRQAYFVEMEDITSPSHWPEIDMKANAIIFDEINSIKYTELDVYCDQEGIKVFSVIF